VRQTMNRTSAAVAGSSLARAISHISRSMRTQNRGLRTQNRGHPRRIALARQTMNRTSAAVAGSSLARAISHISRSMRTRNRGHPRRTASAQQIGARQVMTRTHTPHSHLTSAAMREDTMQSRTWPAWPHGPSRIAAQHAHPRTSANVGSRSQPHTLPAPTHHTIATQDKTTQACACVHTESHLASLAPRTRSHRDSPHARRAQLWGARSQPHPAHHPPTTTATQDKTTHLRVCAQRAALGQLGPTDPFASRLCTPCVYTQVSKSDGTSANW